MNLEIDPLIEREVREFLESGGQTGTMNLPGGETFNCLVMLLTVLKHNQLAVVLDENEDLLWGEDVMKAIADLDMGLSLVPINGAIRSEWEASEAPEISQAAYQLYMQHH